MLRPAARSILVAGALWSQDGASSGLAARLAEHPELTPLISTFLDSANETLQLLLRGATA